MVDEVDLGPRDELVAALEGLKRQIPKLIEYAPLVAQIKKAQFDALVEQGFSPEQALALIKPGLEI